MKAKRMTGPHSATPKLIGGPYRMNVPEAWYYKHGGEIEVYAMVNIAKGSGMYALKINLRLPRAVRPRAVRKSKPNGIARGYEPAKRRKP